MEHLLNLVIVPTSGTCRTAMLTTPLKLVEARVPRSVIEWFLRSFSIYREDPMLRVLNSFSFESEVDVLLHGDSVVQQYVGVLSTRCQTTNFCMIPWRTIVKISLDRVRAFPVGPFLASVSPW